MVIISSYREPWNGGLQHSTTIFKVMWPKLIKAHCTQGNSIPYTGKHPRWKSFMFWMENGYLRLKFCCCIFVDLYCWSTGSLFTRKDSQESENRENFPCGHFAIYGTMVLFLITDDSSYQWMMFFIQIWSSQQYLAKYHTNSINRHAPPLPFHPPHIYAVPELMHSMKNWQKVQKSAVIWIAR